MHEPDFWTGLADAMEQSIEGNRMIARELGDLARDLLRRFGVAGTRWRKLAAMGGANSPWR